MGGVERQIVSRVQLLTAGVPRDGRRTRWQQGARTRGSRLHCDCEGAARTGGTAVIKRAYDYTAVGMLIPLWTSSILLSQMR